MDPTERVVDRTVDHSAPVEFLGLADGAALENSGAPHETWTLFKLARAKFHFVFPAIMKHAVWCFLIKTDRNWNVRIQVLDRTGKEQAHLNFGPTSLPTLAPNTDQVTPATATNQISAPVSGPGNVMVAVDAGQWLIQAVPIPDLLIPEPGEYHLLAHWDGRSCYLGRVLFGFAPPPPLTDEQISAQESDPVSPKVVKLVLACKKCDSKLLAYTSAKKLVAPEPDGAIFYHDLPDRFECRCGATKMSLQFLRQGMHGFLGRDARVSVGDISYVQRYAHAQLLDISARFLNLIQREKSEEAIQKFLAQNKVLFARFHAKQLFVKPRILGKFNADFAILDSEGVLTLIEIERPSMKLFKKNGHLRQELNHAYEQVQDWLDEVLKHRAAVIEGLGLKPDDVLSIRGCVIAGRTKPENREHLRRHMSQPRQNIEFFTLDMLGQSLARIAHDLP
jgi:hypothetical protein